MSLPGATWGRRLGKARSVAAGLPHRRALRAGGTMGGVAGHIGHDLGAGFRMPSGGGRVGNLTTPRSRAASLSSRYLKPGLRQARYGPKPVRPRTMIGDGGYSFPRAASPALPSRRAARPGGSMGGNYRGHTGNAIAGGGGWQIPKPVGPRNPYVTPMGGGYARSRTAMRTAPPPKNRFGAAKHARDSAFRMIADHPYKTAGALAGGAMVAGVMTRRGPGTGQSTGGVPTGMYGY